MASFLGVTPLEFQQDFFRQNTRVHGLPFSIVYAMICLVISIEHCLVTDRQTDIAYTALA